MGWGNSSSSSKSSKSSSSSSAAAAAAAAASAAFSQQLTFPNLLAQHYSICSFKKPVPGQRYRITENTLVACNIDQLMHLGKTEEKFPSIRRGTDLIQTGVKTSRAQCFCARFSSGVNWCPKRIDKDADNIYRSPQSNRDHCR
jgi:hypothetical protein